MTIGDKVNLTGVITEITETKSGKICLIVVDKTEKGMFESVKVKLDNL